MDHNSPRPRRLGDFGGSYYRGDSFPQPETAPHLYLPELELERTNAPPHGRPMAGLSPPCTSCSPQWRVPASHSGVQAERYDMSYNGWPDAQSEDNVPYAPVMGVAIPYNNQNRDTGNTNSTTIHQSDDRIPACRNPHDQPPTTTERATESRSALDMAHANNAAGANTQPFASTAGAEAPLRSEGMMLIARRYVLDPGTRIDTIHMGSGGYGRLKIVITLEVPDGA